MVDFSQSAPLILKDRMLLLPPSHSEASRLGGHVQRMKLHFASPSSSLSLNDFIDALPPYAPHQPQPEIRSTNTPATHTNPLKLTMDNSNETQTAPVSTWRFIFDVIRDNGNYIPVAAIMDPTVEFSVMPRRFAIKNGLKVYPMAPSYSDRIYDTFLGRFADADFVSVRLESMKYGIPRLDVNMLVIDQSRLHSSQASGLYEKFDVFLGRKFLELLLDKVPTAKIPERMYQLGSRASCSVTNSAKLQLPKPPLVQYL